MKAQFVSENINFEREGDPLTKIGIGKAGKNPFMNGKFDSMPFHEFIANRGDNNDIRWEFLKGAAELLDVPGHKILIALDSQRKPIDEYDLIQMDMDLWENTGKEIEINDEWFLTLDTNDVVHVTKTEEGDQYILGVKY